MDPVETLRVVRASLSRFGFNDYVRHLRAVEEAAADGRPFRIAVVRSYTIEPIEPVLKLRLLLDGFRPTFWFGGYNQYAQEVLDVESPLYRFCPDLVLMMIRIQEVIPDFVQGFGDRPPSEWAQRIDSKVRDLGLLAERLAKTLPAQLIVQNMTLPEGGYFGIFDSQRPDGQSHLIQRFNRELAVALRRVPGAFIWDFDGLVRAKGYENLTDEKMWYVSRNPFRQSAYPTIVDDLMRYVGSALGRTKKCIVLDLDNTLWGGVAGEDGLEGISLGHSYPGNCYRDFQKELLKLHDRGILLAINSKNNEADAYRVIDGHPDMVLRRHHFAATRINWRDKAANVRELAMELNIGLESLIFVDDSPVECELIRRECPECDVVLVPEKPYLLPRALSRHPGVENIRLTDEDRRRGDMYRAQVARRAHEDRCSNLDDFLKSLEIEVSIEPAIPFSIPRIAQLTQKTNQMNMTTRRYTEAQVRSLVSDPLRAVFSVSSKDRFGDDGIVGVMILIFSGEDCVIDTLLLSCRVIGRGIEQAMLAFIADVSRERGLRAVVGEFIPTPKNQPASGFYERMGFKKVGETRFRNVLDETSFPYPPHIALAPTGQMAIAAIGVSN